jgi:hypothetical protein
MSSYTARSTVSSLLGDTPHMLCCTPSGSYISIDNGQTIPFSAFSKSSYYWTDFNPDLWRALVEITRCYVLFDKQVIFNSQISNICLAGEKSIMDGECYLPPEEFLALIKLKLL